MIRETKLGEDANKEITLQEENKKLVAISRTWLTKQQMMAACLENSFEIRKEQLKEATLKAMFAKEEKIMVVERL